RSLGKYIVPIIPDEARTFGMDGLFNQIGIYAHQGQLYEPVDAGDLGKYREAENGQILEEGINEAGAMSSFVAAGSAYANNGVTMVPFYIYYSMFGFQRIGDLAWLAADSRCKGFLLGGTAGRTSLNGEGLQHQDGHGHLLAATIPNLVAYDPAFGYEIAVILQDGLKRMYQDDEDIYYYLTLFNEPYAMPAMPAGDHVREGILKGMYKFRSRDVDGSKARPQLFGSGSIIREALKAQEILADKFGVASDVWSVTSYKELRRECMAVERWNLLHPNDTPRRSYLENVLAGVPGPFVAVSDNMRLVSEQVARWIPGAFTVLGTDGFGRSESRANLRRHFEIDAASVAFATLRTLEKQGVVSKQTVVDAIGTLGIDPEKIDPVVA
ncbi:MAG: transketolase-like TK C-terminal-containing protein, partial [Planctomycetia bacterium]